MIQFRSVLVQFDPTKGQTQTEPFTASFPGNVRVADACLKGYDIGYTDKDHHLWRMAVDVDVNPPSGNDVSGQVHLLLRDSSGFIDDRFDGAIEVLVIADVN